jgi:hypothetical protein
MARPVFEKKVIGELINDQGYGQMNTLCCVGDFNGDGRADFATCGRFGRMAWFENGGKSEEWRRHIIADVTGQECGGCAIDLTGSGFPDIINGSEGGSDIMSWWENPGAPGTPWKQYIIAKTGAGQMHDTMIGEVKNDGVKYLVFTNQGKGTCVYIAPLPADPHVSPWPGLETVASDKWLPNPGREQGRQPDEGLAIGDVDNDGLLEIVCGVSYYKWAGGQWKCFRFTDRNYITNKIIIADIDGDGKNEIVLSEGDSYIYGHDECGKLAWFKPVGDSCEATWDEHIVDTGLIDAHSLAAADLCGNGRPDLFVGEIGAVQRGGSGEDYIIRPPCLYVYENDGKGNFMTRHTVDRGTGIHEAAVIDLNGDGKPDIIGKPLHGDEKWKIHVWYNRS